MDEARRIRLVLLGRLGDPTQAELVAARLASEGIATRIRSEASGPYRFTVGEMAVAELWVDELQLDEARQVMMAAEIDDVLSPAASNRAVPDSIGSPWMWRIVALGLAAALIALFVRRFLLLLAGG